MLKTPLYSSIWPSFCYFALIFQLSASNICNLSTCINGVITQVSKTSGLSDCICECDPGFSGKSCENPDVCVSHSPCYHGGKCLTGANGEPYCQCEHGYSPPNCRQRDPCDDVGAECFNGGTCRRLGDMDYICACPIPFTGKNCQSKDLCLLDPDECFDSRFKNDTLVTECYPCTTHTTLTSGCLQIGPGDYKCNCIEGYGGDTCAEQVAESELGNITIPIYNLTSSEPQTFIAFRIPISQTNKTTIMAIKTPPGFRLHIAIRDTYRPECDTIKDQWNRVIPHHSEEMHFIMPEFQELDPHHNRTKRAVKAHNIKYATQRRRRREQYLVIWPEYISETDSLRTVPPVEVSISLGIFTIQCITLKQLVEDFQLDSYQVINECTIQSQVSFTLHLLCNCSDDLHFDDLRPFVRQVDVALEAYIPFPDEIHAGYCYLVLWIVIGMLIVFLILLPLVLLFDIQSWRRTELIVNVPVNRILEETFYLITVITGGYLGASTTANLYMEMRGACNKSRSFAICDHVLKSTCRYNSEDNYLVSSKKHLGELLAIRLWHDNSGPGPDWYCQRIIIQEIRSQKRWYFIVNNWMSLESGTLILTVPAATQKEEEALHRSTFSDAFFHEMSEQHIIWSFFARGSYQEYSHTARVVVFFFITFLRMFFLIYLYGIPKELELDYVVAWEEPHPLKYQVIYYATLATLIGIPFRVLFRLLFTHLKVKRVPTLIVCTDEPMDAPLPHPDPDPLDLRENASVFFPLDELPKSYISNTALLPHITPTESLAPESKSSSEEFQIPSTSVSQTETWISENIKTLLPNQDNLIHLFSVRPKDPELYQRIINDGIVGAVVSMKDKGSHEVVYRTDNEDINTLIAQDIRNLYTDKLSSRSKEESIPEENFLLDYDANLVESQISQLSEKSSEPESLPESLPPPPPMPEDTPPPLPKKAPQRLYVELCKTEHAGSQNCHRGCRIFIWILLFSGILAFAAVTGLFGSRYGTTMCMNWSYSLMWTMLFALVIASLITVLLVCPIIILIMGYGKLSYEKSLQNCRLKLIWINGACILPKRWPLKYIRYFYTSVPGPKSCYATFSMQIQFYKERRLKRYVLDAFVFFSYATCLVLISAYMRPAWYFSFQNSAQETLLAHPSQVGLPETLYSIQHAEDFYTYMRSSFIGSIHNLPTRRETRFARVKSLTGVSWLQHGVSFIIGPIRLRQQRVRPFTCELNPWRKSIEFLQQLTCFSPFHEFSIERRSFMSNWSILSDGQPVGGGEPNVVLPSPKFQRARTKFDPSALVSGWLYSTPSETGSYSVAGDYGTYGGGGYVVDLHLDMEFDTLLLHDLEESGWIDQRTRAVIIEFSLYNPFVRICVSTQIVLERSSFNVWHPRVLSESSYLRLLNELSTPYWCILIIIIFLMTLCLLYFTFHFVRNVQSTYALFGKSVFKNVWLWLDLVIIALGVSLFATWYLWDREGYRIDQGISVADDEFINFQYLVLLRYAFIYTLVAALVSTYVKCWRLFLPSYKGWYVVGLTISLTWRLLLGFLLCYAVLLLSFAAFRTIYMGSHHEGSRNWWQSFLSMVQLAKVINAVKYHQVNQVNFILGPLFYALYHALAYWVSINVIISTFTAGLEDAQEIAGHESYKHTYITFVYSKLRNTIPKWLLPKRKPAKADKEVPITKERWDEMKGNVVSLLTENQRGWTAQQLARMKNISQNTLENRSQKIVSKEQKYRERLAALAKVPPHRLHGMKTQTISVIKQATGRDYRSQVLDDYTQFNQSLFIIKYGRIIESLENISNALSILEAQKRHQKITKL